MPTKRPRRYTVTLSIDEIIKNAGKSEEITLKLSDEDLVTCAKAADLEGMSLSTFVREAVILGVVVQLSDENRALKQLITTLTKKPKTRTPHAR